MSNSEDVKSLSESLDVDESDVRDVMRAASKERFLNAVKMGLPILSFFIGMLVGRMVDRPTELDTGGYPFIGAAAIGTRTTPYRSMSWMGTIILSVILYIFGLLLYVALTRDSYGVAILYGPHSRQTAP